MTRELRIRKITFKAGNSAGQSPLEIDCPSVTVLIGPNNSGKSLALREIEMQCIGDAKRSDLVVESLDFEVPENVEELFRLLGQYVHTVGPDNVQAPEGNVWLIRPALGGAGNFAEQVRRESFSEWLSKPVWSALKSMFIRFLTRRLDGATRFSLVADQDSSDLKRPPTNHLGQLFTDQDRRKRVSDFTMAAFNTHFVVDATGMKQFRMRLSKFDPASAGVTQSLEQEAIKFQSDALLVTDMGDGVKASIGLVAAVHSLIDRILLVDEPEAFLHPTLARRVGQELTSAMRGRNGSLVVATHSAEFLIGCVQTAADVRLIRLTYETGTATARTLAPAEITTLMNDPLLRSANALRALFHRGVVVCEADADRAFYEEVNSRLCRDRRGIEDALFLNAQNWQTILRIIEPLRRLGVPAAGIFDFDVLMDDQFKKLWPLVQVGQADITQLQNAQATAKTRMDVVTRVQVKKLGLAAFSGQDRVAMEDLLARFAEHGLFFVPVGELEQWLSNLSIAASKKVDWIIKMFAQLGADPNSTTYVNAGTGDVWKFLEDIKGWIDNPSRVGIPK